MKNKLFLPSWATGDIRGAEGGFNERADVIAQTVDGTDLNAIWAEMQETLARWNSWRDPLLSRLTFRLSSQTEQVGVPGTTDFEEASEYGQPKSFKGGSFYTRGYPFKFYDLASRFTWMFLAEASDGQIRNLFNMAMEADNRLLFNAVMKTLFNPANGVGVADSNIPVTVYKFYNGDGEVPPTYKNNTFSGTHTHYSTSQTLAASTTLTPGVLEAVEADFRNHGYEMNTGTDLILLANRQETTIIKGWKQGVSGASYDFMPSPGIGGGIYLPQNGGIVDRPTGNLPGQIGTYGPWHIVEESYVPAGYLATLVSGGPDNIQNPIGIREHVNPAYRGLLHTPGQRSDYPLMDSFYRRGFGTGIRQRGGGFLVQVTSNASYTVPAAYA